MRSLTLISTFLLANSIVLSFAAIVFLIQLQTLSVSAALKASNSNIITSSYEVYSAVPSTSPSLETTIIAADARSKLVDDYFARYKSPMKGLGSDIVQAADKYQLPYGLLPAIAMCEGNLGKVIPQQSYNTYGWGIWGDKVMRFTSWQEGIETVSKGLRADYYDQDLTTPEQIMKKYTPSSPGSWAHCVEEFLQELK